jgi:hypothetical protein
MALYPEDCIIPASSTEVMWRSQETGALLESARQGVPIAQLSSSLEADMTSSHTIRKWATKLLDRSLLLGSMIRGLKIQ